MHLTKNILGILILFFFLSNEAFSQVTACPAVNMCTGTSAIVCASILPLNNQYKVDTTIAFEPINGSGKTVPLGDDDVSDPIEIGWPFNFFGIDYDTLYISSNGFITFDPNADHGCCAGQVLPNSADPNAVIAFAWSDLNPSSGGKVEYFSTIHQGGNVFVVNYINVPHFGGGNGVTQQIRLYQGSNAIEIHTTKMPSDGTDHTMGIENETGSTGYWYTGRNGVPWSATNDAVRFEIDYSVKWTTNWIPNTTISTLPSFNVSPIITTTYIVEVTYPGNQIFIDSMIVWVFPAPTAGWKYKTQGPLLFVTDQSQQTLQWYWDFDDGNFSTIVSPVHHYTTGGMYNVMQIVTNSLLCKDTLIMKVDMTHLGIEDAISNVTSFSTTPNPFSGETNINYSLAKRADIQLEIYNILGIKVASLFSGEQNAGEHKSVFDPSQYGYAEGIYILKLNVDGEILTSRLMNFE